MGNNSGLATVDNSLTPEQIRAMKAALFVDEPKVHAYEVAFELGFDESAFSRLWRRLAQGRGGRLPHGIGINTFLETVERIRAGKRAAA